MMEGLGVQKVGGEGIPHELLLLLGSRRGMGVTEEDGEVHGIQGFVKKMGRNLVGIGRISE